VTRSLLERAAKAADDFGASDAWLMFSLWMGANGHAMSALFAATVCAVICLLPDKQD
jgi:hypothetical protein